MYPEVFAALGFVHAAGLEAKTNGRSTPELGKSIRDKATTSSGSKSVFLHALRAMVDDESNKEIIRWTEDGTAVQIISRALMPMKVLCSYFKSTKFTTFQRQLSYFSFVKANNASSRGGTCLSYKHEFFRKDRPEDMEKIKRKVNTGNSKTKPLVQGELEADVAQALNQAQKCWPKPAHEETKVGMQQQRMVPPQTEKMQIGDLGSICSGLLLLAQ
jgi:hypothetical protein